MHQQLLDLTIILKDEVDDEELDILTRQVRDDIAELDVEEVRLAPGTQPSPGAMAADPITVGSIVALIFAGAFPALIKLVESWVTTRQERMATIKVKVGEAEIEFTYPVQISFEEMAARIKTVREMLPTG